MRREDHVKIDLARLESDRQRKGLSLTDIAERANLPLSSVSRLFNGARKSLSVLTKVAPAIGYEHVRYLKLPKKV